MILLLGISTFVLFVVLAYVWGRTQAPKRYDVWFQTRQCPTCGELMIPGGDGLKPICWPCQIKSKGLA